VLSHRVPATRGNILIDSASENIGKRRYCRSDELLLSHAANRGSASTGVYHTYGIRHCTLLGAVVKCARECVRKGISVLRPTVLSEKIKVGRAVR
jgi:hypothetical protein